MRDKLQANGAAFFAEAVPVLKCCQSTRGFQYLLALLVVNDMIIGALPDAEVFSFDEAVELMKQLLRIEPLMDIRIVRSLLSNVDSSESAPASWDPGNALRLLEIVETASSGSRILPLLSQLVRHPDPKMRSKAVLLAVRRTKSQVWVQQCLGETDSRVRANAIEALWGTELEGARELFWVALADPDNRVSGNALLGLYQMGEAASIPLIAELVKGPAEQLRRTGVWVMGETKDPRFLDKLGRLLGDPDPLIRAAAFQAIGKVKKNSRQQTVRRTFQIEAIQAASKHPAWVQLHLVTHSPVTPGLKATTFALYENGQPVLDYEVDEINCPDSLSLALAVPDNFEHVLPLRKEDACQFLTHSPLTGTLAALTWLLSAVLQTRGSRHVILIDTEEEGPGNLEQWQELGRAASAARVAFHSIAPAASSRILELCAQTGGIFCPLTEEVKRELPKTLETLCASLTSSYTVRYRSSNVQPQTAIPNRVKLQVQNAEWFGELDLTVAQVS